MWPLISMATRDTPVLFLNHIPTFYNRPKGQVRSAWGGSPFSSGKYSLLLFCILLSLMLSEEPAASGISISPGCVNRFWDRAVVGKLLPGMDRDSLNVYGENSWVFCSCEWKGKWMKARHVLFLKGCGHSRILSLKFGGTYSILNMFILLSI